MVLVRGKEGRQCGQAGEAALRGNQECVISVTLKTELLFIFVHRVKTNKKNHPVDVRTDTVFVKREN